MSRIGSSAKNKYITALIAMIAPCVSVAYSADSAVPLPSPAADVHARITRDALRENLSEASIKAIVQANLAQDAAGSEDAAEKRRHFDGSTMAAAVAFINREKNKALNLAAEADSDPESRADALRHFGVMLHTVQDFYLHSNYVELALEDERNRNDPYNIPLVDWNKVPSGYTGMRSGQPLAAYSAANPNDALNKEGATTPGGAIVVTDKVTQFSIASDLAGRETQRQWNLFETLVRNRCSNRAAAVLAALKQAGGSGEQKPAAAN
jgi:hypothetical protein